MTAFHDIVYVLNAALLGDRPVRYVISIKFEISKFFFSDGGRLYTACWHIRRFHSVHPMVLFSHFSKKLTPPARRKVPM